MRSTEDFLKPRYSKQVSPFIRNQDSMKYYLDALGYCVEETKKRFDQSLESVDHAVLHGGLCKSVTVKAMRTWATKYAPTLDEFSSAEAKAALNEKYLAGCAHGAELGGLYTGSMYFGIHSLIEHGILEGGEKASNGAVLSTPKRCLFFSYGSGSTASMLRATIHAIPMGFEKLQPILQK